eukprot:CFRG4222T1
MYVLVLTWLFFLCSLRSTLAELTAREKQILSPDYTVFFDGVDDYISFTGANDESLPNETFTDGTFTLWFKHYSWTNAMDALMGFGQEEGPSLRVLQSTKYPGMMEVAAITSWTYSDTAECITYPTTIRDDSNWHFVGLSYSLSSLYLMVDGVLQMECTAVNTNISNQWTEYDLAEAPKWMLIGRFSVPTDGVIQEGLENRLPFWGEMDDVRVYLRPLSLQELVKVYDTEPDQPTDRILAWFDFNNGGPSVVRKNVSDSLNYQIKVHTGGGYKRFSPVFLISNAPLYSLDTYTGGDVTIGETPSIVIQGTLSTNNDPNSVLVSLVSRDYNTSDLSHLLIYNATSGGQSIVNPDNAGYFVGGTENTVALSQLPMVLPGTQAVFNIQQGFVGDVIVMGKLLTEDTLTPGENETSDAIFIRINVRKNSPPLTGNAGYAIECDGVNDFMYAPYFKWPTGNHTSEDGETRFGGGPITVEGWMYLTKDYVADSAIWAIGSGEQAKEQTEAWNPYKKTGRLYFSMPSPSRTQKYRWDVGSLSRVSGSTTYLGGTWVHFAVVHTQVMGTRAAVYLNGELALEEMHDYQGVGEPALGSQTPSQPRVEGLSVCTWMFWSGVFHKGAVDELRIWNYTKTQDEIQRDMYTSLLDEDLKVQESYQSQLVGYWTFDDNDPHFAYDFSGHGNHLRAAGCAVCDNGLDEEGQNNTYYQGFNTTSESSVCAPIAKEKSSEWYTTATVFGGAYCYYGNTFTPTRIKEAYTRMDVMSSEYDSMWTSLSNYENRAAVPNRVISGAPMGHTMFDQFVRGQDLTVKLNATDPDDDPIQFIIKSVLEIGTMSFINGDTGLVEQIYNNTVLPWGVKEIQVALDKNYGGGPFQFEYQAYDGSLKSGTGIIKLFITCSAGYFVNAESYICDPCPVGTFSDSDNLDVACVPCPLNYMQDKEGQTQCVPCPWGLFSDEVGQTSCKSCTSHTGANVEASMNGTQPTIVPTDGQCEVTITFPNAENGVILQINPPEVTLINSFTGSTSNQEQDRFTALSHRWLMILTSYPRTGEIYQVKELEDGSLVKDGDPLYNIITTPAIIYSSYGLELLDAPQPYATGPVESALGAPDLHYYTPFRYATGQVKIEVKFSYFVYPLQVDVFLGPDSAALTRVEVYNYESAHVADSFKRKRRNDLSEKWDTVWEGSGKVTDEGATLSLDICPRAILSDRLRLTFDSTSATNGRGVFLDAVRLYGSRNITERPSATVTDDNWRVFYQPIQGANTTVSLAVNFQLKPCGEGSNVDLSVAVQSVVAPATGEMDTWLLVVSWVVVAICEIALATSLVAVLLLRHHPRLRKASPTFMLLMLVGSMIAIPAPVVHSLEIDSNVGCILSICMWLIGFILTFGSLFIKTYRIRMIFTSSVSRLHQGLNCSDRELLTNLAILLSIAVVFLAIYFPIAGYDKTNMLIQDELWLVCPGGPILIIIISAQLVLMTLGAILAFQVRKVPADFQESNLIALSIYNWLFISAVAVPTMLLTPNDGNTQLAILLVYFTLMFMVTALLLVFYKLFRVYRDRSKQLANVNNGGISKSSTAIGSESKSNEARGSNSMLGGQQNPSQITTGTTGMIMSAGALRSEDGKIPFALAMFTSSGGAQLNYMSGSRQLGSSSTVEGMNISTHSKIRGLGGTCSKKLNGHSRPSSSNTMLTKLSKVESEIQPASLHEDDENNTNERLIMDDEILSDRRSSTSSSQEFAASSTKGPSLV